MKTITIIQRLRSGFLLLYVAAILGAVVVAWHGWRLAVAELAAETLRRQVGVTVERIRHATLQMGDALRGVMLDPRSEVDRRRKHEADSDLNRAIGELRPLLRAQPDLLRALEAVGDYDTGTLNPIEDRLLQLASEDPAKARVDYAEIYLPARRVQDQALNELISRAERLAITTNLEWRRLTFSGAVVVSLLGVLGLFLARRIETALATSLQLLWQGVDRIRSGTLNLPVQLPERNEFAVLGDSLNRLGAELAELAEQLRATGGAVLNENQSLSAALGAGQHNVTEMETLASGLGVSARRVLNTSAEMARTIHSVSVIADQTAMLTDSSRLGLSRMGETMESIHHAADRINAKLAVLNEKAGNINQVIITMAKVADQTNLLSLNAAIEAEKAGEYGRGFAVVATEIQRLADQTAVAAEDIEQMVKEMQSAVTAGVMGMDKFADEVRRGVGDVHKVSGQLDRVLQQVQGISPQIEAVNQTMNAQTEGARQIYDTVAKFGGCSRAATDSQQQAYARVDGFEAAARRMQEHLARFKPNH